MPIRVNGSSRFVETTAVVHEPPLAPPEYRGGMNRTVACPPPLYSGGVRPAIPPLYSGGARGGRPASDLWKLAFKVVTRIVKRDLLVLLVGCGVLTACGGPEEPAGIRAAAARPDGQARAGRVSASPATKRYPARAADSPPDRATASEVVPTASTKGVAAPDSRAAGEPPRDPWQPPEIDESRVTREGIRKLQGARLTLYTDLASQPAIDELPEVFDRAVPLWCEYFEIPVERTRVAHDRLYHPGQRRFSPCRSVAGKPAPFSARLPARGGNVGI